MKLIVGLGNPGEKYHNTRHNIGAYILDMIAEDLGCDRYGEKKYKSLMAKTKVRGEDIILMKPLTYMNLSGQAVVPFMQFFKIPVENLLVLHDEIDLKSAEIKQKVSGGHAGHNGLRDIIAKLGSRDFARLRIGVGRPVMNDHVADYVLSSFPSREREDIIARMDIIQEMVDAFIAGKFAK